MTRHASFLLLVGLLAQFCGPVRAQAPIAGQPYQVPPGYESYDAGTGINYGGFSYVSQGDGTMLLAQHSGDDSAAPGPDAGQIYQVPAGYEGYGAGAGINYGGVSYVVQNDGTMVSAVPQGYGYGNDVGPSGYTSNYGPSGNTSVFLQGQWVSQGPYNQGNSNHLSSHPNHPATYPNHPGNPNHPGTHPTYLNGSVPHYGRPAQHQVMYGQHGAYRPHAGNMQPHYAGQARPGGGQNHYGGMQPHYGGGQARPGGGQVHSAGGRRR